MTALLTRITRTTRHRLGKLSKGATAVEYGLLVALISGALIGSVALFGTNLSATFSQVTAKIGIPSTDSQGNSAANGKCVVDNKPAGFFNGWAWTKKTDYLLNKSYGAGTMTVTPDGQSSWTGMNIETPEGSGNWVETQPTDPGVTAGTGEAYVKWTGAKASDSGMLRYSSNETHAADNTRWWYLDSNWVGTEWDVVYATGYPLDVDPASSALGNLYWTKTVQYSVDGSYSGSVTTGVKNTYTDANDHPSSTPPSGAIDPVANILWNGSVTDNGGIKSATPPAPNAVLACPKA